MTKSFSTIFIIFFYIFIFQNATGQSIKQTSVFLEELTWVEVQEFVDNDGTTIIIPTGGTEQNGPHMVLGKHNFRVKYMAEKIALELGDAIVAPTIAFVPEGKIDPPEDWMTYPGTISLPEEYFIKLLEYTCRSLNQHGFIDILLIGDSGGNQNGMRVVSEALNDEWKNSETRVHFISEYYGKPFDQMNDSLIASGISPDIVGSHAGIIDVSFLMAIDSSMIRSEKLAQNDLNVESKLEMGFSGDPSKANVTLGEQMIQKTLEASLSQILLLKVNNRK